MLQTVFRRWAKSIFPQRLDGVFVIVRLFFAVLSFIVFFTQPTFADAQKSDVAVDTHQLPMPSVRVVKTKAEDVPHALVTPPDQNAHQFFQYAQATLTPVSPQPNTFFLTIAPAKCVPWDFCNERPGVQIHSTGQFKSSKIVKIQVQVGQQGKVFDGDDITIRLPTTSARGDWLNYWAIDTAGERSSTYAIKYMSYKTEAENSPYYFALLSDEWNSVMPSGSLMWQIFPPIGSDFPAVLDKPLTAGYLHTTNRYGYLAGRLIVSGTVSAKSCSDGGVYTNGYATPCGEQQAADKVLEWQNRYDQQIFDASVRNNIPARILKGMIAQETQFWPSSKSPYEIGLGSLTENGVEMLLAWNPNYFFPLCIADYGKKACSGGYFFLNSIQQGTLKQNIWEKTLVKKEEMDVLAAVLFASAAQVNQMVNNTRFTAPGEVTTYEDMWKIAVGNYHSGSGCIGYGMSESAKNAEPLTWTSVSSHLLGDCQQAIAYVENVWRYASGQP